MYYGYCSSDFPGQTLDQQEKGMKKINEEVRIYKEENKREILKVILNEIKDGDILILKDILKLADENEDSDRCFNMVLERYQMIFNKGADIIFIDQPEIDSSLYRKSIMDNIDKNQTSVIAAVNQLLTEQIKIALTGTINKAHNRKASIRNNIKSENRGLKKGTKLTTRKEIVSKEYIKNNHKDFGGNMTNHEIMENLHIANNTFYKYKKELLKEYNGSIRRK